MIKCITMVMLGLAAFPFDAGTKEIGVDPWMLVPKIRKINPSITLEKAQAFSENILRFARHYNLSPALLIGIIGQESSFRDHIEGQLSPDYGPMQINHWWFERLKITKADVQTIPGGIAIGTHILALVRKEGKGACWWSRYNSKKPANRREYEFRIRKVLGTVGVEVDCSSVKGSVLSDWDTWFRKRFPSQKLPAGSRLAATAT